MHRYSLLRQFRLYTSEVACIPAPSSSRPRCNLLLLGHHQPRRVKALVIQFFNQDVLAGHVLMDFQSLSMQVGQPHLSPCTKPAETGLPRHTTHIVSLDALPSANPAPPPAQVKCCCRTLTQTPSCSRGSLKLFVTLLTTSSHDQGGMRLQVEWAKR